MSKRKDGKKLVTNHICGSCISSIIGRNTANLPWHIYQLPDAKWYSIRCMTCMGYAEFILKYYDIPKEY